jgi:hypothetical protein
MVIAEFTATHAWVTLLVAPLLIVLVVVELVEFAHRDDGVDISGFMGRTDTSR